MTKSMIRALWLFFFFWGGGGLDGRRMQKKGNTVFTYRTIEMGNQSIR